MAAAFVPTSQEELHSWLTRFNGTLDSLDVTKLNTIYTQNVRVQFAEVPIMDGLDAVATYFKHMFANFESMEHEIDSCDMVENRIFQPCHITWRLLNDDENEEVTVRALSILRIVTEGSEAGLVYDARFYLDAAPLMSALSRVATDNSYREGTETRRPWGYDEEHLNHHEHPTQ